MRRPNPHPKHPQYKTVSLVLGSGGAMELWSRMIPSLLFIWRGNYIPKVKAVCRQRGFDDGSVRAPLQSIPSEEASVLETCLEPLG